MSETTFGAIIGNCDLFPGILVSDGIQDIIRRGPLLQPPSISQGDKGVLGKATDAHRGVS